MEGVSRRSSGLLEGDDASVVAYGSTASLTRNVAAPGAAESRFSDGPGSVSGEHDKHEDAPATGPAAEAAPGPAPQVSKPPIYRRRWFIIVGFISAAIGLALLFIVLWPVVKAIAQLVVNRSVLNVDQAIITNPQNGSFTLSLIGIVSHTGIFSASIAFTEPINITWRENSTMNTPLGYFSLHPLSASHKRAYINDTTTFYITDENAFGRFAAHLIVAENFTWNLKSENLRVQALKFPVDHGIHFNKELTLPAINNFNGNVLLKDLQLPSDNPDGGINFLATTELNNPSPFALDLGTVNFALTYGTIYLGQGTGTKTQIYPGKNDITLSGRLIPQSGQQNLSQVSQLFTNYINGDNSPVIAQGLSTVQNDGTEISWLSIALQSLMLDVPFKPTAPLNPIRAIQIDDLGLTFTEDTAWAPAAVSNSVHASLQLPFGFGLSISEIQNDFNISKNDSTVVGLSTPVGASQSAVQVVSPTNTEGTINITIANTSLSCPPESHAIFSAFNAELTDEMMTQFRLVGNSRAVANTSIGQIILDPIKVNVSTGLWGLKGLSNGLTVISNVDVTGGTTDHIVLSIDVDIYNPSSLELATGDLTLQLFRETALVGTTLLPNLSLVMGNNSITASGAFTPNNSPLGQQTLDDFVGGKDVTLGISGYSQSTNVASLLQAFESLNISAVLPGLKAQLLSSAALKVLPTTGTLNNISQVTVDLVNPFTAGLDITQITSSVTSHGISLGTIATATSFTSTGKSSTTSPSLDLNLNFDPAALFTLARILAVEAGEDPTQLDGIVKLGGYSYITATNDDAPSKKREVAVGDNAKRDNIYTGFNIANFIDAAFKELRSDVELQAVVGIGQYVTTLNYTQLSVPIVTDSSLNYIIPVLAKPIVQKIVDGTVIGIDTVLISDPELNQFGTTLAGSITNAGPFDARISFPQGLTVSWAGSPLGSLKLPDIDVVGDVGAQINAESTFAVADVAHLTDFTKALLTQEEFEWDISAENVTVAAIGITVTGISLPTKKVTLKGFNGLQNGVIIQSFDLPANDPAGGIHLTLQTTVTNPSQVGVSLSSIGFNSFFDNVLLGPVASTGPVNLLPNTTSLLPLAGRLVEQTSEQGLAAISSVFNNFIHGENSDVTVQGTAAGPSSVTWLNEGIQALEVATVLPNQGKLDIIKSIDLAQLSLMFTEPTEWDPATGSNNTVAAFTLPFNFPVDITALAQNITTGFNGQYFAELEMPKGPAATDIGPRIIHLTFANIPFAVFGDKHNVFSDFVAAVTIGNEETLSLTGVANADASTAAGLVSLQDIEFSVDSTIAGLQGLVARPASVSNLDVASGTPDYLLITVNTALYNPSNLTIGIGDVSFGLEFEGATIGSALLNGMVIQPGNASYPTDVLYSPQDGAIIHGQHLLENYIQGVDSDTTIRGSSSSTPIQSLQQALSQITLTPVSIPALHRLLIPSAALEFPPNIVQTGIAQSSFVLDNPFSASINIYELTATATYNGLTLGKIDHVDRSSDPISAPGHQNITSPIVPLNFNLNPLSIVQLIGGAAQANNVDLGPLVQLFQIVINNPSFQSPIMSTVDTGPAVCVSGKQFDVAGAILNALKGLKVDLAIETSLKLDQYATDLAFTQSGVTAVTDQTALYLIGAVAAPIVQSLVDGANLQFTQANITNLSDEGFDLDLAGSMTNIGPLDAKISFPEPVLVNWQGYDIATISLPSVCAAANDGVPDYTPKATLHITDSNQFTAFATYLLHNPSFTWTISTDKLQVEALGTIFDNVSLKKDIHLTAFNGLPGVTINNFMLPSDDPAGGIHIETDALIPSTSQLGIDLGSVGFVSYFENVEVGPLSGSNLFLAASTTTKTHLTGRIIPQSGPDLDTIGQLFSEYLQGDNITLIARGDSVVPTGSSTPISWLSAAFKTLSLSVTLPGQRYTVIQSIAISDFRVQMTSQDEAYDPLVGSDTTLAQYKNPFGFSLQVIQSTVDMIIGLANNGTDAAELKLPLSNTVGGVSTGNIADLPISFQSVPMKSVNDGAFQTLFQQVTDTTQAELTLKGTADVIAKTAIGNVPISGIIFNVPSSLRGINSFDRTAQLSNTNVNGSGGDGGNQYIISPLTTTLQNPSNVTLQTNNIALPVIYNGVRLGRAAINSFNLVPGSNTIPTEFHYFPDDANDTVAQSFLTDFLQTTNSIPLTVKGDAASTPYGSLQPALEGVQLATAVSGINNKPIITEVTVTIGLTTLVNNMVEVEFKIYNPLETDLVIEFVQADASVNGQIFAHFDQSFDNFVVSPGQTASSGTFGNVLLTQGALASLVIIPLGYLDIASANTARLGQGGYQVPWMHVNNDHVPTTYNLGVSLADLKLAALNINGTLPTASLSSLVDNVVGPTSVLGAVSSVAASLLSSPSISPSLPSAPLPLPTGAAANILGPAAPSQSV